MEEAIRDLLDPTLRSMGVRGAVRDAQLQELFAEVVGGALAKYCRAERLERGSLVIATTNTALSHQLQLDSPRVIADLNSRLGAAVVHRFRFVAMEPGSTR